MLGNRFARIVEECLHRLDRGEYLPDILADFPAEAEQLKPLLLVAMASRSMILPRPDQSAQRLGKNQMFSEMDQSNPSTISSTPSALRKLERWVTGVLNARRAQLLIQPAPSYRLAIIALVVVFGSGLFFFSAFASPGNFISSIRSDFQQILAFMNIDPIEGSANGSRKIFIYGGDNSSLAPNPKAKGALLLDVQEDQNPEVAQVPPGSKSAPPVNTVPDDITDDQVDDVNDTGPVIVPPPFPHPASFVIEVVSDTAKEKNPVWDQLPFTQTDPDPSDDCGDQDEDCDVDDGSDNGPPSWVFDLINEKIKDDGDNDDNDD
jgi:hypothetical protein